MLGCLGLIRGVLTLAYVATGVLGVVHLVFLWNWSGFWQWTLLSLGLAVVRFVVIGGLGTLLMRSSTRSGAELRRRVEAGRPFNWYEDMLGYERRTEIRLAQWEEALDELDSLLAHTSRPDKSLVKLERRFETLTNEQRREKVPTSVPEGRNAAMVRLFEVEGKSIQDIRATGGENGSRILGERWELLEELGLDERELERIGAAVPDDGEQLR